MKAQKIVLWTAVGMLFLGCKGSDNKEQGPLIKSSTATQIVAMSFGSLDQVGVVETTTGGIFSQEALLLAAGSDSDLQAYQAVDFPICVQGSANLDINDGIDLGDVLNQTFDVSLQFDGCEFQNLMLDGAFDFNFSSDGGLLTSILDANFSLSTLQTFTALSISDSNAEFDAEINGTIASTLAKNGNSITWDNNIDLAIESAEGSITFDDFQQSMSLDVLNQSLSVNVSGQVSASALDASFEFEMIEPLMFQGGFDALNPAGDVALSGKFKVVANDASSVTVTIINSSEAQLEISFNNDGVIDEVLIVPLVDLELFGLFAL